MRADQLAIQANSNRQEQLGDISRSAESDFSVPIIITADTLLLADFPQIKVDCSSGDVILTVQNALQIGDFTWEIQRTDTSAYSLSIIPEDPTHLINGLQSWILNPYESVRIKAEQDNYSAL